jgi:hypothetical protein
MCISGYALYLEIRGMRRCEEGKCPLRRQKEDVMLIILKRSKTKIVTEEFRSSRLKWFGVNEDVA